MKEKGKNQQGQKKKKEEETGSLSEKKFRVMSAKMV